MLEQAKTPSGGVPTHIERWLLPGCLAAAVFALYCLTLSGVHTYDALTYINDVNGRTGLFFHPHHLLYSPTGWLLWQAARLVGYSGNAERVLQLMNALAGVTCGWGLYRLTLHLTGQMVPALVAASLVWFNFATWYFSVEVEVYLVALVWLVATLWLLVELVTTPRPRTPFLLGLALGGAALYHQTNGLLVGVTLVAVLLAPLTRRQKLSSLLVCGAIAGSCVAVGYGSVGFLVNGYRSPTQFFDWVLFFAKTGWWGHAIRDRWSDLGAGLSNTISPQDAWPYWVGIGIVLLIGSHNLRRWWRVVLVCLAWIGSYGAFFAWWEARNIEFWIAALLPVWLLVGLSVAVGRQRWRGWASGTLGLLGCALLGWHNYPLIEQRGDPALDPDRHVSVQVRDQTLPDDLVIEPGGVLELYLSYYEGRSNVRTINSALFDTGGDIERALAQLDGYIRTNLQAGHAIMVGRNALQLPPNLRERHDVPQTRLDTFWLPYRAVMIPAVAREGETVFWRIPSAGERAMRQGWQWTTFDWGWQATNVVDQQLKEGWCFNPGVDPMLASPVLGIETAELEAVEVTLATSASGQQAQLFLGGPDGSLREEMSVRWELIADGMPHRYTLPLSRTADWPAIVSMIRLDPVAVGDGTPATRTCVQQVRFTRSTSSGAPSLP